MKVDFQQVISQMANVERFQNISTVQVAESIRHSQNVVEQREAQKKTENVVSSSGSEKVEGVKDEDRKRRALLTRGKQEEEGKGEKRESEDREGERGQEERMAFLRQSKIDIKA